jgi:uncharacterized protein YkwD
MQKRRIFLPLLLFPIVSISLLILLHRAIHTQAAQNVLAAKVDIQYVSKNTTPIPTIIITLTPTNTPTPTKVVNISKRKIIINSGKIASSSNISPTDFILEKINAYRASKGLTKVSSNTETCNFAKIRAEEISRSFTHDGFNKRVKDNNLPYPSYHDVTENIAYNTDYTNVVDTWIASPGHEENIKKNTPFICIGKYGNYYAFEGWRP